MRQIGSTTTRWPLSSSSKPFGVVTLAIAHLLCRLRFFAGCLCDTRCDRVRCNADGRCARKRAADRVGRRFHVARDTEVGDRAVETALVPEVVFGAAEAAVARLDRPRQAAVPFDRRAGVVRGRALAADLVQAVALASAFVVELLDE